MGGRGEAIEAGKIGDGWLGADFNDVMMSDVKEGVEGDNEVKLIDFYSVMVTMAHTFA